MGLVAKKVKIVVLPSIRPRIILKCLSALLAPVVGFPFTNLRTVVFLELE